MTRLAALLRRLADRIDPAGTPAPPPPPERPEPAEPPGGWPAPQTGSIAEVREQQETRLAELRFIIEWLADHDPGAGLLWWESWQLEVVKRLLDHELERRERALAVIEPQDRRP